MKGYRLGLSLLFIVIPVLIVGQQRDRGNRYSTETGTLAFNYSVVPLRINGQSSNRVNIGYAGDGYTTDDLESLPAYLRAGEGDHTVTAHIYDEVIKYAFSDNNYPHPHDLVRRDLDKLQCRLT